MTTAHNKPVSTDTWLIVAALTSTSMLAFASNSLLTRAALIDGAIDPFSFSAIRILSGALALLLLGRTSIKQLEGNWLDALCLYLYAFPFSLAYLSLSTGTGALILFGLVQVTMLSSALRAGERPSSKQWVWTSLAILGLIWLVLPGVRAPDPKGALLMATAGVSWGFYSVRGRRAKSALSATTGNFARALVLSVFTVPLFFCFRPPHLSWSGTGWAIASGALTSGLGYTIWYSAVRRLSASQAATVQLTVPILAALMGLLILNESFSLRLFVSSVLILGGVAGALRSARPKSAPLIKGSNNQAPR